MTNAAALAVAALALAILLGVTFVIVHERGRAAMMPLTFKAAFARLGVRTGLNVATHMSTPTAPKETA